MQAKAKPEVQLGDRQSQGVEPRRVGCGKSPQVGTCHPWYERCTIICYRRSFFSAKPTFFPRSGFFFGRRGMWVGCEATHREQRMGIQWWKLVFGFIPICRLTTRLQRSHPCPPAFCSLRSLASSEPARPVPASVTISSSRYQNYP